VNDDNYDGNDSATETKELQQLSSERVIKVMVARLELFVLHSFYAINHTSLTNALS